MFCLNWPWAGRIANGREPEREPVQGGKRGPAPHKGIGDCGCCFSGRAHAEGFHERPCRWRTRSRRDHGRLTVREVEVS